MLNLLISPGSGLDQFSAIRFNVTVALYEEARLLDLVHVGLRLAAVRIDGTVRRCTNRVLEALQGAVAELDGPHNGVRTTQRLHGTAQRHDVSIVTGLDGLLRADLDAGLAFPALLRLLVESLHGMAGFRTVLVQFHEVVRADVHASSLVLTLTAVALFCTYKCWHVISPSSCNDYCS